MTIKSKQLFIIIGDDRTGKTTLQKLLIDRLCGLGYERLPVNKLFDINHPEIKRKYQSISFGNRSYQEKIGDYETVDNYFQNHFHPADIAFISSHLVLSDIQQMITNGRNMFYNVNGLFWTNSIDSNRTANSQISSLDWNERFLITNPYSDNEELIQRQLEQIADSIVDLLINRTSIS
ncbi:hypothetical protein [Chryseobacterium sp. JV274]|jgi:uridine kinase|uniref:hypothetical protein n=1 Tax=unclassified Chryseobacterium TaxID=2593645 RepID=UPI0015C2501D|nr:hypothetical protein [Chryseobacterium sp. JV274]CAD0218758.1 conserved protein of unknown function [Chryseobacterium sp. JV274]